MKIGVISDTHIRRIDKSLPKEVYSSFCNVDMILHAGDILLEEVIIELGLLAPIHVVAGNNDSFELYKKYGDRKIIEVERKRIGLIHQGAFTEFIHDKVDCVVFGHSHKPYNEVIDGVLYFNPGSAMDKRRESMYSIGILHVGDTIKGELIYF